MKYSQESHILANGSFTIPEGSDSVTIRVPGFKRTPPTLVLTPIGDGNGMENANVTLFVDDTSTTYSPISYDLTEAFETKNDSYKYTAPAEVWDANSSNSYPEGGLQAWYRFNEDVSSSGNVIDHGTNARDGSFGSSSHRPDFSTTSYPSKYIQQSSCTFDGTANYVRIGTGDTWNTLIGNGSGGTSKMTLSAWVQPGSGGHASEYIFSFGGTYNTQGSGLYLYGQSLRFYTVWSSGAVVWYTSGADRVEDDVWTHVCATYDAGEIANAPTMYINGNAVAFSTSDARGGIGTWEGVPSSTIYLANSYPSGNHFAGNLADLAIWNTILNETEVKALYDVSIAGVTDNSADGWPLTIKRSSDIGTTTVQWQAIASDPTRLK
tara:strand:- start:325 stop:1461 length:1137 start_codon:yes stop_codon:yes gene_type:complete